MELTILLLLMLLFITTYRLCLVEKLLDSTKRRLEDTALKYYRCKSGRDILFNSRFYLEKFVKYYFLVEPQVRAQTSYLNQSMLHVHIAVLFCRDVAILNCQEIIELLTVDKEYDETFRLARTTTITIIYLTAPKVEVDIFK